MLRAGLLSVCLLSLAAPIGAQQFDNFDGDNTFEDFQLDTGDGEGTGLTLSEDGGLVPDGGGGDIQLNLGDGGSQGTFESFPGVSGPVTSVSQPATEQGTIVTLRALDKMLGQPTDVELSMGQTVVFGRIAIRAVECRYPAGDPGGDAFAHLEVLDLEGNSLFDGWMIASSPALNALEHSRYDVWVLRCTA
ncbi:DUF2155 domain-containing protein [Gymnodinialimonas hymeniacidonis]|uniref:DUF2155 domain-containing protein n=1 Tax=Gymnodinialimonas hymeniacidonis TaxID=3126508 RepID=UPI0034C616EE